MFLFATMVVGLLKLHRNMIETKHVKLVLLEHEMDSLHRRIIGKPHTRSSAGNSSSHIELG